MKNFLHLFTSILTTFILFYTVQPSYSDSDININPIAAEQTYNGFYCYITGDYKSAVKYFSKAIETEPNDFVTHHQRGLAYYSLKKYKKALCDYDKAIELNPEYADAYFNRSLVRSKLKDYQGASEDMKTASKLEPKYQKAIKQKDCISPDDYQKGQEKNIEMERIENSSSGQTGQGFLSAMKGDNNSAIKYFSKSIELEQNNPIAYHQRGIAYYNLKNYKNALNDFDKAIELDPNKTDAYGNRSLVKLQLKDYEGALQDIEKVLDITPDHPKAIKQKELILETMNKNREKK